MFSALSERLTAALKQLAGRGVLTEDDVREGLREVRRVLLEADVAFDVARRFTERVRERAVGVAALKAVSPGQQLVKIVHDELVALLGERAAPLTFASLPPTVVLLAGLQGSGKTTTAAKLAQRLKWEQKAPFLVAADVYRPAAEEQLRQLGAKVDVPVYGASQYLGKGEKEEGKGEAGHDVPFPFPSSPFPVPRRDLTCWASRRSRRTPATHRAPAAPGCPGPSDSSSRRSCTAGSRA